MYVNPQEIAYHSERYGKTVTVPKGYVSDGATGAIDLCPEAFMVHDWLCGNWVGYGPRPPVGRWDDGFKLTNFQASTIYSDILRENGFWFVALGRWTATYLFGGTLIKERDRG